jgi:protein-L-isoaspartate(D-aspartate) O-methyltransferase
MSEDPALRRRFFAEEIQAVANLRTAALVEALASVPRERFLGPGPWVVRGEGDVTAPPRQTPDGDPRHVYHNYSIGIDPARQLFNGAPGLLAFWIDALGLRSGDHVLHVGSGPGYYSAVIAGTVGPAGRVLAVEVDLQLASAARSNLAPLPGVEVRHGDGTAPEGEAFDAILVNAGTTHPHESWLAGLAPGGRLVLPLTCTMPQMGAIGKGPVVLITRPEGAGATDPFDVRVVSPLVVIYSAVGLRDEGLNERLGKALMRGPFPTIRRLRCDPHDAEASCWLHRDGACLTSA